MLHLVLTNNNINKVLSFYCHYKMGDTVMGTTVNEKDLGFTIIADMKVSEQCGIAASNSWVD